MCRSNCLFITIRVSGKICEFFWSEYYFEKMPASGSAKKVMSRSPLAKQPPPAVAAAPLAPAAVAPVETNKEKVTNKTGNNGGKI